MKPFDWVLLVIASVNIARIVFTLATASQYILETVGYNVLGKIFILWVLLPCLVIVFRVWG